MTADVLALALGLTWMPTAAAVHKLLSARSNRRRDEGDPEASESIRCPACGQEYVEVFGASEVGDGAEDRSGFADQVERQVRPQRDVEEPCRRPVAEAVGAEVPGDHQHWDQGRERGAGHLIVHPVRLSAAAP